MRFRRDAEFRFFRAWLLASASLSPHAAFSAASSIFAFASGLIDVMLPFAALTLSRIFFATPYGL